MKCNVVEGTSLISIYNGLNYSTREVNRNFKIKVSGIVGDTKYHCLVGVYGLLNIVGCEMANKLLSRAFRSKEDKQVCKLIRGIKITFYCY